MVRDDAFFDGSTERPFVAVATSATHESVDRPVAIRKRCDSSWRASCSNALGAICAPTGWSGAYLRKPSQTL